MSSLSLNLSYDVWLPWEKLKLGAIPTFVVVGVLMSSCFSIYMHVFLFYCCVILVKFQ
jgi:hypothetical protein